MESFAMKVLLNKYKQIDKKRRSFMKVSVAILSLPIFLNTTSENHYSLTYEQENMGDESLNRLIEIDVGYELIAFCKQTFIPEIHNLRKEIASELGFSLPLVHVRSNENFRPYKYEIRFRNNVLRDGEVSSNTSILIKHLRWISYKIYMKNINYS